MTGKFVTLLRDREEEMRTEAQILRANFRSQAVKAIKLTMKIEDANPKDKEKYRKEFVKVNQEVETIRSELSSLKACQEAVSMLLEKADL